MTKSERAKLRELAQSASRIDESKFIRYDDGGGRQYFLDDHERELIADFYAEKFREYYAAIPPKSILSLLDELEKLQTFIESHNWVKPDRDKGEGTDIG